MAEHRSEFANAGQPVESTALSTAAGGQLPLLDSAVQTQQSARQLFYSPVYSAGAAAELFTGRRDAPEKGKRAATQPAGTPGLRYTLLRRQPDGSYLETDPRTIFHAGVMLCRHPFERGSGPGGHARMPVAQITGLELSYGRLVKEFTYSEGFHGGVR